jgi:hypothetical protein
MDNRLVRERWKTWVVVACAVTYGLFCLATAPPGPFTQPDSEVYLAMSPLVPLGYPAFLRVMGTSGATIVQPIVFSIALVAASIGVLHVTGSLWLAMAAIAGILLTPELRAFHVSILTESLFISGLLLFLAAAIQFVRTPSARAAALAGLAAGATATIRLTAAAWLPVAFVMVLLAWRRLDRRRWAALLAVTLTGAGLLALERGVSRILHGDRLTSLTGPHVFAKAALIDAPAGHSDDRVRAGLDRHLEQTYAPMRAFIRRAPPEIRISLILFFETCLQSTCLDPVRASLGERTMTQANALLAEAGWSRIGRAPLEYLFLTTAHYRSLWTVYKLRHPDTARVMREYLAANRPVPFERDVFEVRQEDVIEFHPYEFVRYVQPLVLALGAVTLAVIGWAIVRTLQRRETAALLVASVAALTAHASLLFSALAAAGISRFMQAVFPAVIVAVVVTTHAMREHLAHR